MTKRYDTPHWQQFDKGISMVQPPSECFWSGAGKVSYVDQCIQLPARGFLLVFYNNHSPKMHSFQQSKGMGQTDR